ncbi:L-2-hydroxyglutarate oxidase [Armatimonas sp.]|uniref:L-2-hydroxyglutarate oxidase n=1 Tax=Armatimonas sp. TaxID=1872638 RepID=UPI003750A987
MPIAGKRTEASKSKRLSTPYDYAIIGGGIVGLATAYQLGQTYPKARLLLIEKESDWAAHQTGHNSGVIHSGIYYKPGSAKTRMAVAGARSMVAFCEAHGVTHELCGKVIVAAHPDELPRLEALEQRAAANGILARRLTPKQLQEHEPHVRGVAALHVPSTGIIDYKQVAQTLARLGTEQGAELRLQTKLLGIVKKGDSVTLQTTQGDFPARFLINCGGLYSDRIAALGGVSPRAKIIPFRGEYYELIPERRSLVRGLIYPVPNPSFPFLGRGYAAETGFQMEPRTKPAQKSISYALVKLSKLLLSPPLTIFKSIRYTRFVEGNCVLTDHKTQKV